MAQRMAACRICEVRGDTPCSLFPIRSKTGSEVPWHTKNSDRAVRTGRANDRACSDGLQLAQSSYFLKEASDG